MNDPGARLFDAMIHRTVGEATAVRHMMDRRRRELLGTSEEFRDTVLACSAMDQAIRMLKRVRMAAFREVKRRSEPTGCPACEFMLAANTDFGRPHTCRIAEIDRGDS